MAQIKCAVNVCCQVTDGVDLDMLAPYISMDDDFQLSFFSAVPEANTDVNTEPPPELTAINRKRSDTIWKHAEDQKKNMQEWSRNMIREKSTFCIVIPNICVVENTFLHRITFYYIIPLI